MSEVEKYNKEYSAKDAMTDPMDGRKKRKKKKLPFAKRLQDMIFDEVSLVGKPANELSQFVLHKSADTEVAGDEEVDTISLSNQVEIEGEEIRMSENLNEENLSSMLEETPEEISHMYQNWKILSLLLKQQLKSKTVKSPS